MVAVSLFCEEDEVGNSRRERILYSFFDIFLFEIVEQLEDKGEKRKREKQEKE